MSVWPFYADMAHRIEEFQIVPTSKYWKMPGFYDEVRENKTIKFTFEDEVFICRRMFHVSALELIDHVFFMKAEWNEYRKHQWKNSLIVYHMDTYEENYYTDSAYAETDAILDKYELI